jgi:molybdate transport system substrate-binding protein
MLLARRTILGVLLCAALLCFALPGAAQRKTIRVAAASDLQTVMPQIGKAFEEKYQVSVQPTFGSSGNFFAQIQNGAPFDLFFSADSELPAKLVQSGLADARSSTIYAIGGLVLWMPADAKCNPQAKKWDCLLDPGTTKIAIGNPAHAPYGRAAVAALQSARIYDQVRAKLVMGENISQAAQFVQSGSAQAGILALSQMRSPGMSAGQKWEIPRENYPSIEQTVVILKSSQEKSAAEEFLKFVTIGPGRTILAESGFYPPPTPSPTEGHK